MNNRRSRMNRRSSSSRKSCGSSRPIDPHFTLMAHHLHPRLRYPRFVKPRSVDPLLFHRRLLIGGWFGNRRSHFALDLRRPRQSALFPGASGGGSTRRCRPVNRGSPQRPRHGTAVIAGIEAGKVDGRVFSVGGVVDWSDVDDRVARLLAAGWIGRSARRTLTARRSRQSHTLAGIFAIASARS